MLLHDCNPQIYTHTNIPQNIIETASNCAIPTEYYIYIYIYTHKIWGLQSCNKTSFSYLVHGQFLYGKTGSYKWKELTYIYISSSSSSCSWRFRRVFLFLNPQDEVGPSTPSLVVPCSFVLSVYIVMLVLVVYLCPSSVRVVATFSGIILFPLLYSVLLLFP